MPRGLRVAVYFLCAAFVMICTVASVVGMMVVRKRVGLAALSTYHEVAGYLLSVIGTLYAVLLGFIVVDAMTKVQEARVTVEQEANAVANVFMIADGLPATKGARIQELCQDYAERVSTIEWKLMQHGEADDQARTDLWKIWKVVSNFQPANEAHSSLQQALIQELANLANNRRVRMVNCSHGVAPIMWIVLIVGGVFTVFFTYFFGVESLKAQVLMTVLVAVTLSLNVFLVYLFGFPFDGDTNAGPDAFKMDLVMFKKFKQTCAGE